MPEHEPNHPLKSLRRSLIRKRSGKRSRGMVTAYVPEAGDIVMMDFDPQVGREQTKRRPPRSHGSALQPRQRLSNHLSLDQQAQTLSLRPAHICRRNRCCRSRRPVEEHGLGWTTGQILRQGRPRVGRQSAPIHHGTFGPAINAPKQNLSLLVSESGICLRPAASDKNLPRFDS
jgi:hypothetical protein